MAAFEPTEYMSIFTDGIPQLLDILPPVIKERLQAAGELESLIEVVLDYGRPAEARYRHRMERFENAIITEHDLEFVVKCVGEFSADNRAGIERTLHRISCIRNRQGKIIGLTCRVGRALEGTIDLIDDIVRSGKSILLLGKPGIGKTTKLREVARVLSDEVIKRVIIVDTSNEIAGDGDVPHPAIGNARRMQVKNPLEQHQVMIEAVENHMPEVIVIDEIGTELESGAARTIAERGVMLVATAHGQTLENLMLNPTLCDLIGGIQAVTLSDDEARRRGTQKTVLERKAPPTFDVVIELLDFDRLAVHSNVQKTVDLILRGLPPRPEIRVRLDNGKVEIVQTESVEIPEKTVAPISPSDQRKTGKERRSFDETPAAKTEEKIVRNEGNGKIPTVLKVFPYGIARTRLERAIRDLNVSAYITNDLQQADVIISIRSTHQNNPNKLKDLQRSKRVIVVKSNTYSQIAQALNEAVGGTATSEAENEAVEEVLKAIESIGQNHRPVELKPRDPQVRKVQLQVAEANKYAAECIGQDPYRRIRILPRKISS